MTEPSQASYKKDLIQYAMEVDALKYGSFTLIAGRTSPYFFNSGLMCTGPILATLAAAYASTIAQALKDGSLPEFDILFGMAYKGIPFASNAAVALYSQHGISVSVAYNRKEVKDHGEGGIMVGEPVKGKRVVILDDVMTSGKTIHGAIETIRQNGGEVVGVIHALDRQEVGQDGVSSAVKVIEGLIGEGRVFSILTMTDLMIWLERKGLVKELESLQAYWDQYGLK
ncbi:Orotate phosphoribosyltransferase [Psilocybe cubensis]|uniref:Orotate phosphoribosyltransferase n=2 Tax=Psilocybe cubensis TaxID=181762 RepID=A0ACB8GQ42_PSICU|nr:Orotate phosphoribosyltransferase [Psilocybe cubensis]KAH9477771.1 Orotate phosphoribosyltransferase [Psilocybe cubensis]